MSTTIEHDGFTIESNHETAEAMQAAVDASDTQATHEESERDAIDGASQSGADSRADVSVSQPSAVAPVQSGRKAKPRDNPQARISELTERSKAAEEKASRLEAELAQARQAPVQQQPRPVEPVYTPAPVAGEKFPSFDTWSAKNAGSDYEDYIDARASHVYEVRHKATQAQQAEDARQADVQRLWTAHQNRLEKIETRYPDYKQALDSTTQAMNAAGAIIAPALQDAILRSDSSADVVYWLATHPQDAIQLAKEVASLPVSAAPLVKQLLELRLGAGVTPGSVPTAELSKAKPPVRPVGASSVIVPEEPGEDEPFDAYFSRMNTQDRKRGRL